MAAKKRTSRPSRRSRPIRRSGNKGGTIRELLTVGHKLEGAERRTYESEMRKFRARPLVWKKGDRRDVLDDQVARTSFGTYSVGTYSESRGFRRGHTVLLGFDHRDGRRDLLGSFPNVREAKARATKHALENAEYAAIAKATRR